MSRVPICLVILLLIASPCSVQGAEHPNVVLIISDDQTYSDFGFMGNSDVQTPHIDRLASQSARYVNGYVPSSVCRPSLVSILTGLYPHQHGIYFNHPPPGFRTLTTSPDIGKKQFDTLRQRAAVLIRSKPTLPRQFAATGYRCFQTGKYWEGHWNNAGFTEGMTTAQPSPGAKNGNKTLANGDVVAHGNGDHGLSIGRETMQPIYDFIDDCNETPFLVWYAPFLPHTPHDSPERYFDLYQNQADIPEHRVPYYAACSQFDDTVGDLINFIDNRGLTENTIFVFVVDNGWTPDPKKYRAARGEWDHTKQSKRAPFDSGLRTPILIRWAGRTVAATHQSPVSSIDLLPTLLTAAGIGSDLEQMPEEQLPGENLWLSATGKKSLDAGRAVFGAIFPGDAKSLGHPEQNVAYRWVRRHNLKLITAHKQGASKAWGDYLTGDALFDLDVDPTESRNLIKRADLQPQIEELRQLLDDWWNPDSHMAN